MDKAGQIEKLKQEILKQKVCADLAAQATQLVMGDGNLDSQIVFVGEAPGKNEDLSISLILLSIVHLTTVTHCPRKSENSGHI